MIKVEHDNGTSYANFEAYKSPDRKPYFAFTWMTRLDQKRVVDRFKNIGDISVIGTDLGRVTILDRGQEEGQTVETEVEWAALSTRVVNEASFLVRLDTNGDAFVWQREFLDDNRPMLGIITEHPIDSLWLRILLGETATPEARRAVDRNIGRIANALEEFKLTPFGAPIIDSGFTKDS